MLLQHSDTCVGRQLSHASSTSSTLSPGCTCGVDPVLRRIAALEARVAELEGALRGMLRINCTPRYPDEIRATDAADAILRGETTGGE